MDTLRIEPLAFPKASLLRWEEGQYQMLSRLGASSFVRRIIEEKLGNRHKPGRRFFGEAFVTTHVPHQHSYYGSFKWLTSWPARTSGFGAEYRTALKTTFPSVSALALNWAPLAELLAGKKPMPPDLWLTVNGDHRFIEVKLPGDRIRPPQIAGLALIATGLGDNARVTTWLYNLYPKGGEPDVIPDDVEELYRQCCTLCRRPNKRMQPTAPGAIMKRRG